MVKIDFKKELKALYNAPLKPIAIAIPEISYLMIDGTRDPGIILNPVIDRAIGYILTDEKIGGSVHVAFGRSDMYGGNVQSNMHWDFVTAPDITLEVEYTDGKKKLLMKDGKLLR